MAQAQAENNAKWAEYRAEINSRELEYQQSVRDYETAFTRRQIEADRARRQMEQAVAEWRTNYEFDAQKAEFDQTAEAIAETLTFRYNEYRRQQEALVRDAKRTIAEVNEDATAKMTTRVMLYQQDMGRVRAVAGVSGAGTSTMARKMRELAFFKGVDMTTLERNRRRTVTALRDQAMDKVAALTAAAQADQLSAQQTVNKMALSLGMAAARRDAALQITEAGGKLDAAMADTALAQLDVMSEAQRRYTDWAKEANVGGAVFEAQSARLQGAMTATAARYSAIGSGLQILGSTAMNVASLQRT